MTPGRDKLREVRNEMSNESRVRWRLCLTVGSLPIILYPNRLGSQMPVETEIEKVEIFWDEL